VSTAFLYDGYNRKFSRAETTSGVTTTTVNVWNGWNLIEECNYGTSTPTYSYIYGIDGVEERLGGTTSPLYYFHDALGSVTHVTDSSGTLKEWYKYDRFGAVTILSATNTQLSASAYDIRHLFTSQLWMPNVKLYDYRNRVYSPILQRFMQTDPIGFGGDPSHLYRYCGNSPLAWNDYLGEDFDWKAALESAYDQYEANNLYRKTIVYPGPRSLDPLRSDTLTTRSVLDAFLQGGDRRDNEAALADIVGIARAAMNNLFPEIDNVNNFDGPGFGDLAGSYGQWFDAEGDLVYDSTSSLISNLGSEPGDYNSVGNQAAPDVNSPSADRNLSIAYLSYPGPDLGSSGPDFSVGYIGITYRTGDSFGGTDSRLISASNPYGIYGIVQVFGGPGLTGSRIPAPSDLEVERIH